MSRRLIIILLGIVGVTVVLYLLFGSQGEAGTKVYTEEVKARTIQEVVDASGKIFPQTEVKISSDVSGEIVELYIEEGDSVQAGQLLAKIDPDVIQSQVERGQAQVNSSKAQLANARSQVEQFKAQREQIGAQLQNAREIHERNEGLKKEGVISDADIETSLSNLRALEANFRAAEANIRGAEQSVESARFGVQSAQATLSELRTSLRRTSVYAPVSGIVSLLSVEEGERVVGTIQMAGTEMMRIANLGAMEVRVEVSENDIPRVSMGDKVIIEVDAYLNRDFAGTITQIANSSTTAATATAVLNSDQVTNFEVTINIDPSSYADLVSATKPYPFRPGMSATVEILTQKLEGAPSVPIEAVTTREREEEEASEESETAQTVSNTEETLSGLDKLMEVVFVVDADTVRMAEVETGIQDNDHIVITQGLEIGDEIVVGPYDQVSRELKAGAEVRVVPKEEVFSRN